MRERKKYDVNIIGQQTPDAVLMASKRTVVAECIEEANAKGARLFPEHLAMLVTAQDSVTTGLLESMTNMEARTS